MISAVVLILSFVVTQSHSAHNVTIEDGAGDMDTNPLPIYEPLQLWQPRFLTPGAGDTNPANISEPISVTTTYYADEPGWSWMTLIFNGE